MSDTKPLAPVMAWELVIAEEQRVRPRINADRINSEPVPLLPDDDNLGMSNRPVLIADMRGVREMWMWDGTAYDTETKERWIRKGLVARDEIEAHPVTVIDREVTP